MAPSHMLLIIITNYKSLITKSINHYKSAANIVLMFSMIKGPSCRTKQIIPIFTRKTMKKKMEWHSFSLATILQNNNKVYTRHLRVVSGSVYEIIEPCIFILLWCIHYSGTVSLWKWSALATAKEKNAKEKNPNLNEAEIVSFWILVKTKVEISETCVRLY